MTCFCASYTPVESEDPSEGVDLGAHLSAFRRILIASSEVKKLAIIILQLCLDEDVEDALSGFEEAWANLDNAICGHNLSKVTWFKVNLLVPMEAEVDEQVELMLRRLLPKTAEAGKFTFLILHMFF